MKINILATQWGSESYSAEGFFDKVLAENYDGIEINMPQNGAYISSFLRKLEEVRAKQDFAFVGQAVLSLRQESFKEQYERYEKRLFELCDLQPDFINAQTGKDFYSFDENCHLIELAMNISAKRNIPILHETHRGKFSFHALGLLPYLEKFPEIKITADLSHFCCVSESLLLGQDEILEQIFPFVYHIHARIGFEEAPQVNDFTAPEWENHVAQYLKWWQRILEINKDKSSFSFLTEFGPEPYMPTLPFTQSPVTNQWKTNVAMKNLLRKTF